MASRFNAPRTLARETPARVMMAPMVTWALAGTAGERVVGIVGTAGSGRAFTTAAVSCGAELARTACAGSLAAIGCRAVWTFANAGVAAGSPSETVLTATALAFEASTSTERKTSEVSAQSSRLSRVGEGALLGASLEV